MNEEETARQTIEKKIADWDLAYTQKDIYGYLGHCIPESAESEQRCLQAWANIMSNSEMLDSKSVVRKFILEGNQAKVVTHVKQMMVVIQPQGPIRKILFGWLTRFVFVNNDIRHSTWVKTAEGWLCQSDETVSTKVRVQRKPAT